MCHRQKIEGTNMHLCNGRELIVRYNRWFWNVTWANVLHKKMKIPKGHCQSDLGGGISSQPHVWCSVISLRMWARNNQLSSCERKCSSCHLIALAHPIQCLIYSRGHPWFFRTRRYFFKNQQITLEEKKESFPDPCWGPAEPQKHEILTETENIAVASLLVCQPCPLPLQATLLCSHTQTFVQLSLKTN